LKSDTSSAHVEYLHVCDYAFVSGNGKTAIIGIFDRIYASTFPVMHPVMYLAVQVRSQPNQVVSLRVVIESQSGEKVIDLPEQSLMAAPDGGIALHAQLLGVVFNRAGRYSVSVISRGEVLATKTLELAKTAAAKTATA